MTPIEIKQVASFLAVAEAGSFRKAGAGLNVGQSTISRRVQRLEDILGVSLFERRPNGTRLTLAGSRFAAQTRSILQDLEVAAEIARTAGVGQNGHLRVGMIASLSRGPFRTVVERFLAVHIDVEVSFTETDRSELYTLLSHRRIDVIYAAGDPEPEIGDGLVLAGENVFLAVSGHHAFAERQHLLWAEVHNATFVVSAREPGPEIHDYILRRISDLGRTASVHRHRLGREGIMNLVSLGFGLSLVADHWRGVKYPNVVFVPIGDPGERVPFSLTWRPENDNPALRRFISLARIEAKRNGAFSGTSQSRDPLP